MLPLGGLKRALESWLVGWLKHRATTALLHWRGRYSKPREIEIPEWISHQTCSSAWEGHYNREKEVSEERHRFLENLCGRSSPSVRNHTGDASAKLGSLNAMGIIRLWGVRGQVAALSHQRQVGVVRGMDSGAKTVIRIG